VQLDYDNFDNDLGQHFGFFPHDDIVHNLNGLDSDADAELANLVEIFGEEGVAYGPVNIVGVLFRLQDDLL
jgi:hypothetical protein